eukprot:COSAG06_NODE_646_length_13462_cov_10.233239_2_plen_212_part_00
MDLGCRLPALLGGLNCIANRSSHSDGAINAHFVKRLSGGGGHEKAARVCGAGKPLTCSPINVSIRFWKTCVAIRAHAHATHTHTHSHVRRTHTTRHARMHTPRTNTPHTHKHAAHAHASPQPAERRRCRHGRAGAGNPVRLRASGQTRVCIRSSVRWLAFACRHPVNPFQFQAQMYRDQVTATPSRRQSPGCSATARPPWTPSTRTPSLPK